MRAVDRRGAELPWTLLLDGREISLAEFRSQPLAGSIRSQRGRPTRRGRSADSPALAFTLDAASPWVDLVATSGPAIPAAAEPSTEGRPGGSRKRSKEPEPVAACDSGLEYLDAGGDWAPVPCATAVAPAARRSSRSNLRGPP